MRAKLALILSLMMVLIPLLCPIQISAETESSKTILIDYSHGQDSSVYGREMFDPLLFGNLTAKGYEVIIATGGLNSSILENVDGFLLGSIRGNMDEFNPTEIDAVANWFGEGNRFLWVAYDSDYPHPGGPFINGNSTLILEAVGSHVYGENTHIWDLEMNAGAEYRPIATVTSNNSLVADIVEGVDAVLMHGATCLYGSNSDTPSSLTNPVALENTTIANVTPFLYYSPKAFIMDQDEIMPIAHNNYDNGSLVACAIEFHAGLNKSGIIIVSGSAPYGSYCPMFADHYYNWTLNGYRMILQAVDFAMNYSPPIQYEIPIILAGVGVGAIFVVIVILDRRESSQ
ncbi:MAG: hypothetical protein ACFFEE_03070 [Candidatus Thorarchaeota archaeon]